MVARMKDQRALAIAVSVTTCIALLGLWQLPSLAMLWVALFGFGAGAALHSRPDIRQPANRAQPSGCRAVGHGAVPRLFAGGRGSAARRPRHDATGGWELALACCAVATVLMAVLGSFAGRAATI
jgi:CP family cyanate transporter-like MFS transporter